MRLTLINQFYTPDISPTAHLCASLAEHRAGQGDRITVLTSRTGYLVTWSKSGSKQKFASPMAAAPVATAELTGTEIVDRRVGQNMAADSSCSLSPVLGGEGRGEGPEVKGRNLPHGPSSQPETRNGVAASISKLAATPFPVSVPRVRRLLSTAFGSRSKLGRLFDWLTFYLPAFWVAATLPRQDVFITLTTPPFIGLAGWLHKLLHPTCRLILWNMDVYPEAVERTGMARPGGIVSRLMRSANRAIFRKLDHLICLDAAMLDLLLSQYTPANRRIPHSIIPNWERADLFPPDRPSTLADSPFAEALAGKFVVLYLGNAGYGHEFQTLIDAADALRNDPVIFLFVGGGALRPWIANACKARNLNNILLRDYVPKEQTPAVMARADAALITLENPMLGVMSPSKLHANLAMSLPVIYVGPEQSNVDAAIGRFNCGISLRPGHAAGMAAFIRQMISTPPAHTQLRQNARTAFEAAYCDRVTLPQFDLIFECRGKGNG